jgi:RNA polymerase subunit RPABC4/transcription elongation factor Spt4
MQCTVCHHVNEAEKKFCVKCGHPLFGDQPKQPVAKRTCKKCGALLRPASKFCPACGKAFGETGKADSVAPDAMAPGPLSVFPVPPPPAPSQGRAESVAPQSVAPVPRVPPPLPPSAPKPDQPAAQANASSDLPSPGGSEGNPSRSAAREAAPTLLFTSMKSELAAGQRKGVSDTKPERRWQRIGAVLCAICVVVLVGYLILRHRSAAPDSQPEATASPAAQDSSPVVQASPVAADSTPVSASVPGVGEGDSAEAPATEDERSATPKPQVAPVAKPVPVRKPHRSGGAGKPTLDDLLK